MGKYNNSRMEFLNSINNQDERIFMNSNGAIDPSSAGMQYITDSLSFIRSKVIEQKFYEIPIADFMPVDVGEAAWGSEVIQNLTFQSGGDFYAGDVNANPSAGRTPEVNAYLQPIRMPTQLWGKGTSWTLLEIKQAAMMNNWDAIKSKVDSLKKDWVLGIQKQAFLGHPTIPTQTGLLTNPNVTINTALIPEPLCKMTVTELRSFIKSILGAYWNNSNNTAMPDTFLMPTYDYLGLADFVGDTTVVNPLITKIEVLIKMFREMTDNPNFKIRHTAYNQATRNSKFINKDRYVLYRNDPETLKMSIPIDFTLLEAGTGDYWNWQQKAYGQYAGVLITRHPEVLYLDSAVAWT